MNQTFATELVRRLAPQLKEELAVQPILPLQIKLHLERLRLMELIRAARETKPRATVPTAQLAGPRPVANARFIDAASPLGSASS